MRRILVASFLGLTLTTSTAFAAEEDRSSLTPAVAAAATALAQRPDLAVSVGSARSFEPHRPALLPALYAGSALLQGYDAYSTLAALKRGGVEANPLMAGLTKHPAAFVGLKAGMAAMSIMAAEKMWKNNNRVGSIVTMAISNSVMAMVAANNARVLGRLQK